MPILHVYLFHLLLLLHFGRHKWRCIRRHVVMWCLLRGRRLTVSVLRLCIAAVRTARLNHLVDATAAAAVRLDVGRRLRVNRCISGDGDGS